MRTNGRGLMCLTLFPLKGGLLKRIPFMLHSGDLNFTTPLLDSTSLIEVVLQGNKIESRFSPGWGAAVGSEWRTCELVVIVSTPATRMVLLFKVTLPPLVALALADRGSSDSDPIQAADEAWCMAFEDGIMREAACTVAKNPRLTLAGLP